MELDKQKVVTKKQNVVSVFCLGVKEFLESFKVIYFGYHALANCYNLWAKTGFIICA